MRQTWQVNFVGSPVEVCAKVEASAAEARKGEASAAIDGVLAAIRDALEDLPEHAVAHVQAAVHVMVSG